MATEGSDRHDRATVSSATKQAHELDLLLSKLDEDEVQALQQLDRNQRAALDCVAVGMHSIVEAVNHRCQAMADSIRTVAGSMRVVLETKRIVVDALLEDALNLSTAPPSINAMLNVRIITACSGCLLNIDITSL